MPDLRVVAERSEKEIREQKATRTLKSALVNLAANLLRVIRGAGKPDRITEHLRALAEAYVNWEDVHGRPATDDVFHELLNFPRPEPTEREEQDEMAMIEYAICRHALQIVASRTDSVTTRE